VAYVAVGALLVRLVVLEAFPHGGYDLRIYAYFAALAAHGHNPYTAPPHGAIPGVYGDNQPIELLLFGGLLRLHSAATTLRVFFACLDAVTVVVIGVGFPQRSHRFRLALMTFVAFNPFLLLSWTALGEDKPLSLLFVVAVLALLENDRIGWAWVAAAGLFAVKFESAFFLLPLALHTWRERGRRFAGVAAGLFSIVAVLSEIPFFPASLRSFERRSARINLPPMDAALTVIPQKVGLYSPMLLRAVMVLMVLVVAWLFWRRALSITAAVVLSFSAAFLLLPDEDFDRILLIAVSLLFVVRLSGARLAALWVITGLSAVSLFITEYATHPSTVLREMGGAYGSIQHVLWMNAAIVLCATWLLLDRVRVGRRVLSASRASSWVALGRRSSRSM
jgi:hypothetical protein